MPHEKPPNRRESMPEISLEPPVVESFLDPARAAEVWPANIAANKDFLKQIEQRQELNGNLNNVIDRLPRPDISLQEAIKQGHITEEQTAKMYTSLSGLLESGQDYQRIILYLPFEFLPNKAWQPSSEKLQQATDRFRQAYMKAWQGLLPMHDVRANFVDGDVLEVEQRVGDLPRVVKAAHLIPKMMEKGLMEFKDVMAMIEKNDDQTLKNSITDALPVMADLGLLAEKKIQQMKQSPDQLLNSMAAVIEAKMQTKKPPPETRQKAITLSSVQEEISKELSLINDNEYGNITEKRKGWLIQKNGQEVIKTLGADIATAINENKLTDEVIADFLASGASKPSKQVLIEGISQAIESIASTNLTQAQALCEKYQEALLPLWKSNSPSIQEDLAKTFRRLHQLGLVNDNQLAELNITIPKLAGPFSENLKLMQKEMGDIKKMTASIESNPELSKLIYPVALVYGSRLKGYGAANADIDLAVFVRPGISFDSHDRLQELLKETFAQEKAGDVLEFWLEEKDENLNVRDFADSDISLGESSCTYILFGAAWEGNKEVMAELREKLLVPYMSDVKKEFYGHDARTIYVEELERDTLQYRLMHKGYERFYPPYGGIHTPHSNEIDGESMFWDSGYRQLATKLYASRVFLPKITAPK